MPPDVTATDPGVSGAVLGPDITATEQRDEIVNVQGMIEDTHDKWLDQEEEYMQERRAILSGLTYHNQISTVELS